MGRVREGYIFKQGGWWFARVTYTDRDGRRRNLKRAAALNTKTSATDRKRELIDEAKANLAGENVAAKNFAELADYYEKKYLIPVRRVQGRKVAGLASLSAPKSFLAALRAHFRARAIRSITRGDLESYKVARLDAPTKQKTDRSIASVNRELALLRRMFSVAVGEGWLARNPFTGAKLINPADERKRIVEFTREDEARLLAACIGPRVHLRPILVCAIDTGMRLGEMLKLRWSDVSLETGIIQILATNTKTQTARQVSMTSRVQETLSGLWALSTRDPGELVFGIKSNVRRAFRAVREAAGMPGLHLHDLRHVTAFRLVAGGLGLSEVGKILGHAQPSTTYRYANVTDDVLERAQKILEGK